MPFQAKVLALGFISSLMSAAAMAEPPLQPGDTLESLSQVKVSTTVNGQPGSIEELAASGQIRVVQVQAPAAGSEAASADPNALAAEQPNADLAAQQAGADSENLAAAQDAQNTLNQEQTAAQAQAPELAPAIENGNAAALSAPSLASSADAPVNADAPAATEAAVSAAPEAPAADSEIQASPEAPEAAADPAAQ